MKSFDLKKMYGDGYPEVIVSDGIRLPAVRVSRFIRSYYSAEHKRGCDVSRFMDGSATITASDFVSQWPDWDDLERTDFCNACVWLHQQSDFPEMLRFIMQHGPSDYWKTIANPVASHLPQQEAFDFLARALQTVKPGNTANISQAIATTKHRDGQDCLRRHLASLWEHPELWEDADFVNWVAFDATTCIEHLIELGAPVSDFTEKVKRLSEHCCFGNRDSCCRYLSKHFDWLR